MEHQTTKIPRLREIRYAKNQTTCIDLRPSRIHTENQPPQIKRTISLTQIVQYKPLTPEQFIVKYKNYPQKFCKKSCIICRMRKPQLRVRGIKIYESKADSSSIHTQTTPSKTPSEDQWNAETQTKILKTLLNSTESPKAMQAEHSGKVKTLLRSLISFGAWFSIFIAIFAIVLVFSIKHIDVLKWVTHKQLRQPKTFVEKILSYFHSDRVLGEASDRSLTRANMPGLELLVLCITIVLTLGLDILF